MVLTAGVAWAYILGQVCAIVTDLMEENVRWRKRMHQLNTMAKERRALAATASSSCITIRSIYYILLLFSHIMLYSIILAYI